MTKPKDVWLPNKLILTEQELYKIIGVALSYVTSMSYIKLKSLLLFLYATGIMEKDLLKLTRKEIGERKAKGEWQLNKNVIKFFNQYCRTEAEDNNAFNVTISKLVGIFTPISKYYGYNVSVNVFHRSFLERKKLNEKQKESL